MDADEQDRRRLVRGGHRSRVLLRQRLVEAAVVGSRARDAGFDVVADVADGLDGLAGGVGDVPVLVALAGEDGAGVAAAHGDDRRRRRGRRRRSRGFGIRRRRRRCRRSARTPDDQRVARSGWGRSRRSGRERAVRTAAGRARRPAASGRRCGRRRSGQAQVVDQAGGARCLAPVQWLGRVSRSGRCRRVRRSSTCGRCRRPDASRIRLDAVDAAQRRRRRSPSVVVAGSGDRVDLRFGAER